MIDPRPHLAAVAAAYSLPMGVTAVPAGVEDVLIAQDFGQTVSYAIVTRQSNSALNVGFRGTVDGPEWALDLDILPEPSPYGEVARGIWSSYSTLRSLKGAPLCTYASAGVAGHSRGAPMAALWALEFSSPEICLFACPRLLGKPIVGALSDMNMVAYRVLGDLVPSVPTPPFWNDIPNTELLEPLSSGDLAYYHALSTYIAALT